LKSAEELARTQRKQKGDVLLHGRFLYKEYIEVSLILATKNVCIQTSFQVIQMNFVAFIGTPGHSEIFSQRGRSLPALA
jgi:hypothetical protein